MILKKFDFSSHETFRGGFVGDDLHPIGVNDDQIWSLYYNIARMRCSIITVNYDGLLLPFVPISVVEALAAIEFTQTSLENISTIDSIMKRKIEFPGKLNSDGTELRESQKPRVGVDYPIFYNQTGEGIIEINLGDLIYNGVLWFPKITIDLNNGLTSRGIGGIVGAITFNPFGMIPVYTGSSIIGIGDGNITIDMEITNLVLENKIAGEGQVVVIRPIGNSKFNILSDIKEVFLNEKPCAFNVQSLNPNQQRINISIPQNGKSGTFTFRSKDPFNEYICFDQITIV